jgi:hypothetical protein
VRFRIVALTLDAIAGKRKRLFVLRVTYNLCSLSHGSHRRVTGYLVPPIGNRRVVTEGFDTGHLPQPESDSDAQPLRAVSCEYQQPGCREYFIGVA